MFAILASNPPLGQPSVVQASEDGDYRVDFWVFLITTRDNLERSFDVQVWHNLHSHSEADEWQALTLKDTSRADSLCDGTFSSLQVPQHHEARFFQGFLDGTPQAFKTEPRTTARFTVRFRKQDTGASDTWKWATDNGGNGDGLLLYQPPDLHIPARQLGNFLRIPSTSQIKVLPRNSETPYTRLWLLTAADVAPAGEERGYSKFSLGRVITYDRWFSLVRASTQWLAPRHGRQELAEGESLLYGFLRKDGLHVVLLALSGLQDSSVQSVLCRDESRQSLDLVARNDDETPGKARVVMSVGRSFETALASVMYEARKLVKSFTPPEPADLAQNLAYRRSPTEASPAQAATKSTSTEKQQEARLDAQTQPDAQLRTTWYQEWLDGLGFCTWNSMGLDVNESGVIKTLTHLSELGIKISNFILDDGWQSVTAGKVQTQQGWRTFQPDSSKFPSGLSNLVSQIRRVHPSTRHVAVWHALLGYWGGIAQNDEIAKQFGTRRVSMGDKGMYAGEQLLVVEDAKRLYEQFYEYLEASGVTAVKTDVQFALNELKHAKDRRDLGLAYQRAWQRTSLSKFAGRSVACMAHTPESLFNLLAFNYGPEIPFRNSDDYFPHVEDSHPWHVFCNMHNAAFMSFLNVLPDWDMFQSAHAWASWHAAARCLSGGPIWITDEPGQCDPKLLRSITARDPQSRTVVLRPSVVGRTANKYHAFDEDILWKLVAYNGAAGIRGSSFLGLFNGKTTRSIEVLKMDDMMGIEPYQQYVLRSYRTGRMSGALDSTAFFAIGIGGHEWDICSAHPIHKLSEAGNEVQIASLGLLNHFTGSVALLSTAVKIEPPEGAKIIRRLHVTSILKALGVVGIWTCAAKVPVNVGELFGLVNGRVIPPHCVTIAHWENSDARPSQCLVKIDIERAWDELDMQGATNNEIKVELFVPI